MPIPGDYAERVYAGVLGKIIGVYLGRPFEGWEHERIDSELGEVKTGARDMRWLTTPFGSAAGGLTAGLGGGSSKVLDTEVSQA